MSLKNLVITALFATCTLGINVYNLEKGWCRMHIDEDGIQAFTDNDTKMGIQFYDDTGKNWYTWKQRQVEDFPEIYDGEPAEQLEIPGLPKNIHVKRLEKLTSNLPGWQFEYDGKKWSTGDKDMCNAGDEAVRS